METLSKELARDRFRALRRGMAPEQRQAEMDAIQGHLLPWMEEHARGRTTTAFLSYGSEPPTGRLLEGLCDAGFRVFVPICEPARRLAWTEWYPGVPMGRSAYAPIDEPVGLRHGVDVMEAVDTVLVPAQAVATDGSRLGQGGGYYDRFIASLDPLPHRPRLLSLVFGHEFVEQGTFETDPLDRRVDGVATPAGLTWFDGGGLASRRVPPDAGRAGTTGAGAL